MSKCRRINHEIVLDDDVHVMRERFCDIFILW